ncbi:hypothetical protein M3629_00655 [Paenibacillus polysaccharolyticus]|uniref:hypothetical protein n=1 Tax=Paenibacillus polysaccharolyticus TaxID=582692 RepID=UPI00203D880F|nr:hypothetical protein [Paenibacillus polysaccharolyticus]MCM3131274.1 hypothetical protein [Paenibacillus polysaccharolyticus]
MREEERSILEAGQSIRIGERILNDENLQLILPNWKEIETQVEQIRATAVQVITERLDSSKPVERLDFNNVISILGERGSGKSSVLLTMRDKLMKKDEKDIFLDMIIPEMLEDTSDILGVILLNLKKFIDSRRNEIDGFYQKQRRARSSSNKDTFNSCIYKDKTELDVLWDKVFSLYIYRKKDYSKVIEENFSGVTNYTEERKEALVSELELTVKLNLLFDELILVLNGSQTGKHLIFICFDDVDLNPKRCNEVLNVVLKYLNHSNIITFISGDITKFQEDMISEMLIEHQGYQFMDRTFVGKRTMLESYQELVYDFLKKIMPYSRRFMLQKLDSLAKMNFTVSDIGKQSSNSPIMKELIGRFFKYEKELPYEYYTTEFGKETKPQNIPSFFNIFDDKPRGLINLYSYLHFSEESIKEKYKLIMALKSTGEKINHLDEEFERLIAFYQKIFSMIIETNSSLRKHQEFTYNLYTMTNSQTSNSDPIIIEIHHERLRIEFMNNNFNISQEEKILIIHFLYFVESLVTTNISSIDGKEYSRNLNLALEVIESQRLIPHTYDARNVFALYSELNYIFQNDQLNQIYDKPLFTEKYLEIIEEKFNDYDSRFSDDSLWLGNYSIISNRKEKNKLDIKNKILEDFKQFNFDVTILNRLLSRKHNRYLGSNFDINSNNVDDLSKLTYRFVDYSFYYYFIRTVDFDESNDFFDKLYQTRERFIRVWHIVDQIIQSNHFRISPEITKKYDSLRTRAPRLDVENEIKRLQLFKLFLKDEIDFFMKTRSRSNETVLKNRIKDKDIRLNFPDITIYYDRLSKEHVNYLSSIIGENKGNNLENYVSENRIKQVNDIYPDFYEIADGTDVITKGSYYLLYYNPNLFKGTVTRAVNAYNRFITIHFYNLMVAVVDELIGDLESSQIILLLQDIHERAIKEDFRDDFIHEQALANALEQQQQNIKEIICNDFKQKLDSPNALNAIYTYRNDLFSNFDNLQDQYSIDEIQIQKVNQLIAKIPAESLKAELRNLQRKLLVSGGVNRAEFDEIVKRMKLYLENLESKTEERDSYVVIELQSLAKNLSSKDEMSETSKEIHRVRNAAKERLYNLALEENIYALAYLYNQKIKNGDTI